MANMRSGKCGLPIGLVVIRSEVLGRRKDGRTYVWREYGSIAHLTLDWPGRPGWTCCNRPIPASWRTRPEGVLRPLCSRCAKFEDNEV